MDTKNVIENYISGFHECYLSDPVHLEYISENLCAMLGYSKEEQQELFGNIYSGMIFPEDKEAFRDFIGKLKDKETTAVCYYRMVDRNGKLIAVRDQMTSKRTEEGIMYGYSVVTQISDEEESSEEELLVSAYQNIFLCDCSKEVIQCKKHGNLFGEREMEGRAWSARNGMRHFINLQIAREDRSFAEEKINEIYQLEKSGRKAIVPDIRFHSVDGRTFAGIFINSSDRKGYICINEVPEHEKQGNRKEIFVRTFGYFDVFVDGVPIFFRHNKTKEFLAVLIDRKGGYVGAREAITYLWEGEPYDNTTKARYRKVCMRLEETLDEYGVGYIMEKKAGSRRINKEAITCDFYEYQEKKEQSEYQNDGVYMSQYTWSEYIYFL